MLKNLLLFSSFIVVLQGFSQQITDIWQARQQNYGSTVSVKAIVTTGTSLDPSSGSTRYFQDATGGLSAYGNQLSSVQPGDSIIITGELSEFFQLTQISPIDNVQIINSGNPLPQPEVLTVNSGLTESKECMLIQLQNVTFNQSGSFSGQTNYDITDAVGTGEVRINGNSNLVGTPIPGEQVSVTGVVGRFQSTHQLLPRSINDIGLGDGPAFVGLPEQTNLEPSSFDLEFTTDVAASSFVEWGETSDLNEQPLIEPGDDTEHIYTLTGLEPATFYFARAGAVTGQDTSYSPIRLYSTKSLSSGEIKAYFNAPVDTTVATHGSALAVGSSVIDSLIAIIESAENTLDIAIYNWNNNGITDISPAINDAHNRGVRVRMITDRSTATLGFNDLVQGVPTMESPSGQEYGLMHNKFVIADADDQNPDKPLVWTGSTNWTDNQINRDPNNVIVFQDQALARAYQLEFEEMWGSTGNTPNYGTSKFGPDKTSNTPEIFMVGDAKVELYFSPSDATETRIVQSLEAATDDIEVATMLMTRTPYAYAVRNRVRDEGIYAGFIIDDTSYQNSTAPYAIVAEEVTEGEYLFVHNLPNTLHHKYAIADQSNPWTGDPRVITGSHNWSNAANTRNDENTVIVHSADVANKYFQEWVRRFTDVGGEDYIVISSVNETGKTPENYRVFPNPFNGEIRISIDNGSFKSGAQVTIYDMSGKLVKQRYINGQTSEAIATSDLQRGVYVLEIKNDETVSKHKAVKK